MFHNLLLTEQNIILPLQNLQEQMQGDGFRSFSRSPSVTTKDLCSASLGESAPDGLACFDERRILSLAKHYGKSIKIFHYSHQKQWNRHLDLDSQVSLSWVNGMIGIYWRFLCHGVVVSAGSEAWMCIPIEIQIPLCTCRHIPNSWRSLYSTACTVVMSQRACKSEKLYSVNQGAYYMLLCKWASERYCIEYVVK